MFIENGQLKYQQKQFDCIRTNTKLIPKDFVKILFSLAKHKDKMKENPLSNIPSQSRH